jgi:predicted O-linked N-acetylglucosamine transferase (SPINDLY family)
MTPADLLREGLRLHQAGRLREAEAQYREVLALEPRNPDALHYMGLLAYQAGIFDAAVRLIGESIAVNADNASAHVNLGNALAMLRRLPEAQAALEKGLALDAANPDAWFNLGNIQRERELREDAERSYRRVLELDDAHTGALNNLANVAYLDGRRDEAAALFHQLGHCLQDAGRTADAERAYRQAQAIAPSPGIEVDLAFLTPALPSSVEEIDATRARLATGIAHLRGQGLELDDPLRYASSAIFYTGYHGRDDRELRKGFAEFYLGASPGLAYRAPHCATYTGAHGKIRIGFISKFFSPQHPMSKLYGGIVDALDRRRYDVTIFRFEPAGDMGFGANATITTLPDDLDGARKAIAGARLDVLFYTDIGMDPMTYFLAFARLAPVQCTTFGHPVTTGIANVDYFVSAEELEPERAEAHYGETLIRLSVVPTFFRRPSVQGPPPTRAELGLPGAARVYFCAQNLIKFHPDFDEVLAEILRRDAAGVLVLINNARNPYLVQSLLNRFRRVIPDVERRVRFLPFLELPRMLGFAREADAVLDTPVFGGGTTSLEMFALDVPVVTWPGPFARSRITHALYRQMGVEGLAAQSAPEYVDIALRLAGDLAFRRAMQDQLRRRKSTLYENHALVRELERFFEAAVASAVYGRRLTVRRDPFTAATG